MTYIVTGATGSLGSLVVDALLARGADPADILATGRNAERLGSLSVPTAVVDYSDPSTLSAAVEGGDTLLLVSGSEVGQRVDQHSGMIDAAKDAGVARVIYTSVLDATTSDLLLAPEHKATEEHLIASGVPFTILRNGWYTENYAAQVASARESGTIEASVGDGRVASATRRDFAEAAAVALLDDSLTGRTLELSGDYAWSYDELAAAVTDLVGRDVTYVRLTPDEHRASLLAAGLDEGTAGFVVGLDQNIREGLLAVTPGDLSRLIGRPTSPLPEGL
ncbi:SDR family oxidoreductase [Marisediminicola sp. LYQ85]|uniref:SDR family oxidoreductase n=1 Tax=Marisediminicola sp. LYQ85 TaxID=3391062 RepID=UPI00398315DA